MPFWSLRRGVGEVPDGSSALAGDGDSCKGSPFLDHVRWICQLVSVNLALSYRKYKKIIYLKFVL